jgi:hypothetical protein
VIRSGKIRWAGYAAQIGDMKNAYKVLVGKHEGRKPLGRTLENDIKMDLREIGCEGVDWTCLAHDEGPEAVSCEHAN